MHRTPGLRAPATAKSEAGEPRLLRKRRLCEVVSGWERSAGMVTKANETVLCVKAMQRATEHREQLRKNGKAKSFVRRRPQLPAVRENWRRKTSMTVELEPFMDDRERRAGLKRLVKWIEETVRAERSRNGETEKKPHPRPLPVSQGGETGLGESGVDGGGDIESNRTESGDATALQIQTCQFRIDELDGVFDRGPDVDDSRDRKVFGVLGEWSRETTDWARVRAAGVSVEQICERLGLSRSRLTRLTREYCSLTAQEVVDGVRVRRLKPVLIARLRNAARELWGAPGYYAAFKCEGYMDCEGRTNPTPGSSPFHGEGGTASTASSDAGESGRALARPRSRFFRSRGENLFGELPFEERTRRVQELVERALHGLDVECLAAHAGFSSSARMRRACLTVTGRTLTQLQRLLAADIVEYYLCAEEKALRELALRVDTSVPVYRARELYHGREEPPTAPFLDRWSAAEFAIPEWLARMGEVLAG